MKIKKLKPNHRRFLELIAFDQNQSWWVTPQESRSIQAILQNDAYLISEVEQLNEIGEYFKKKHADEFGGPITNGMTKRYDMDELVKLIDSDLGTG